MKRRLFNILTAISLLLCVGLCMLWLRSYRDDETWTHTGMALFDVETPAPRVGIVIERLTQWKIVSVQSVGGMISLQWLLVTRDPAFLHPGDGPATTDLGGGFTYLKTWVYIPAFGRATRGVADRIGFRSADWMWSDDVRSASVPIWLIVFLTGILPAARLMALLRHRMPSIARPSNATLVATIFAPRPSDVPNVGLCQWEQKREAPSVHDPGCGVAGAVHRVDPDVVAQQVDG